MKSINILHVWLFLLFPVVIWSAIEPHGKELWVAETLPLFIGVYAMVKSYKSFPLTSYSYVLIFIGATLMLIGAHYSYSYVPIGEWGKEVLEFERNNYDKIGHVFEGLISAVILKEVIYRKQIVTSTKWANLFVVSFAIALSAVWEMIEWLYATLLINFGAFKPATDFLGTQNYIWDAQSDMLFATVGAMIAVFIFGKYHEEKMKQLLVVQDV